jgi:YidC/Oxa1 family membrane protein insertase
MFDRNSIIGFVLIAVIMIGYSVYMSPSEEEIKKAQAQRDSLALVEQSKQVVSDSLDKVAKNAAQQAIVADSVTINTLMNDSIKNVAQVSRYGMFAQVASGEEVIHTIENEKLKLNITNKGAMIETAELKEYRTFDSLPLHIIQNKSAQYSVNFFQGNLSISSADLYFTVEEKTNETISLVANASNGSSLIFKYALNKDDYRVNFSVSTKKFNEIMPKNAGDINFNWQQQIVKLEKSLQNEKQNTTIYYKYKDEDVEKISYNSSEKINLDYKTHWIGFKQQFFTTAIIAKDFFDKAGSDAEIKLTEEEVSSTIGIATANLAIPYNSGESESFEMQLFFGPNLFPVLKQYDLGLESMIPLGWGILGWINRFAVIPVFNFLDNFNINYGIIILILTILLKLVLLPFTYKSYLSTAKMRLLKPDIDALNKKLEKEEPLKKQQAVMDLYRRAGVSPFGGCLPMLFQFPILLAMFNFFPASFELRQQAFLWADDLSTYDSIYDLPFNVPFYGDHISLFTILMTISTILYTRLNLQNQQTTPEMEQLKWMWYVMPLIFLGVLNNYSAGLSYYYFLANMITFGQQWLFKKFVDDKKLHALLEENKKKPLSQKKSAFQQRLEEAAKKRGYNFPQK